MMKVYIFITVLADEETSMPKLQEKLPPIVEGTINPKRVQLAASALYEKLEKAGVIVPKGKGPEVRRQIFLAMAGAALEEALEARQLMIEWCQNEEAPGGSANG
jgi:hypothetical protein